jgi:hypothetical protein
MLGCVLRSNHVPGVTMKNGIATGGGAKPHGSKMPREISWR